MAYLETAQHSRRNKNQIFQALMQSCSWFEGVPLSMNELRVGKKGILLKVL